MRINWRKIGSALRKVADMALVVIRATAPDKGQAEPREMGATEAFDKWRDGTK